MARPVLGYPSLTAAILGLRKRDWCAERIGNVLGITAPQVRLLEKAAAKAQKRRADMLGEYRQKLAPHAIVRGVSVDDLVRRLLDVIVIDGLVDAVLDDVLPEEIGRVDG